MQHNFPVSDIKNLKNKIVKVLRNKKLWAGVGLVIIGCAAGIAVFHYFPSQTDAFLQYFQMPATQISKTTGQPAASQYISSVSYEQAIIDAAKNVSPSVVSIVISKDVPVYKQQFINPFGDNSGNSSFGNLFPEFNLQIPQQVQNGTQYQEVGAGSGFIVSEDGLVLTNKHVVSDNKADYAVFTNDGQKYSAKVLAIDPVQDLAVIKIEPQEGKMFQAVTLGDSSGIQIGQTAIAIGNALGQFSNTVSVGVVSGLERTISASDQAGSFSETLENIIQTDAAINAGNSGGPLLNLRGEVIGINTAMAQGAEAIGFAIPINMAKKDIEQVKATNKIVYPFLGVRYVLVDDKIKQKYSLSVDYGALVLKGNNGEVAVTPDSAAEKSGIKENDVVLELNGQKITINNSLSNILLNFNPGDKITLKVLRVTQGVPQEINVDVILGERS